MLDSDSGAHEEIFLAGSAPDAQRSTIEDRPASTGDAVTIADAHLLFHAEFKRAGVDLKLVGSDGKIHVVPGYFNSDRPATLLSPDGAALSGDIIAALAGPLTAGQYAALDTPQATAKAIGHVAKIEGHATVVRNGVKIELNAGDVVLKGDVVETAADGVLGLVFNDGSAFQITHDSRLILSEFDYDPRSTGGVEVFNLVQGSFSFASGKIAERGNMRIGTPVTTMKIDGTAGGGDITSDNGQVTLYIFEQADGEHKATILDQSGNALATLSSVGGRLVLTPFAPSQFSTSEQTKTDADKAAELAALQNILAIKNLGSQFIDTLTTQAGTHGSSYVPSGINDQGLTGDGDGIKLIPVTIVVPQQDAGGNAEGQTQNNASTDPTNLPNRPPVAIADTYQVDEDGILIVAPPGVLSNDSDPDENTLRAVLVEGPQHGTLSFNDDGSLIYTPAANYHGSDTFTYLVNDGGLNSLPATATITVNSVNDAPVLALNAGSESGMALEQIALQPFTGLTLSDIDSTTLLKATVQVTGNYQAGQDVLSFTDSTLIHGVFDPSTGTLTLTAQPGTSPTLDDFRDALRLVTYTDTSDNPSTLLRTLTVTVQDPDGTSHGGHDSASGTYSFSVVPANDLPIVGGETNPAPVGEAADAHAQAVGPIEGTLVVSDLDIGDHLTATVTGNATVTFSGVDGQSDPTDFNARVAALIDSGAVTISPTTTNGGDNTLTWTYDPATTDLDWLREGDTLTIVYTATASDGTATTSAQALTITIQGSNDGPIITGETNPANISEVVGVSSAQDIGPVTGTLTVTDLDLGDSLKGTVTGVSASYNGGPVPDGVDIGALTALTAVTFNSVTSNAGAGNVLTWTYNPAVANLDWLATNQFLTITYTAQVTDGTGHSADQTLTISIRGTNDVPVITTADTTGIVTEDVALNGSGNLHISGIISFTDLDLTDTHFGPAPEFVSSTYGAASVGMMNRAMIPDQTGSQLQWTFLADNYQSAIQSLAFGESIVETWKVFVADGKGGVAPTTVQVTINGKNDAPVITLADTTGTINEDQAPAPGADGKLLAAGAIKFTDADLTDTHHGVITFVGSSLGGSPLGTMNKNVVLESNHDGSGTLTPGSEGTLNWRYVVDPATVQFLNEGQTVTETWTVAVADGNSGVTPTTVTITITGENDAPVITSSASAAAGAVIEAGDLQPSVTAAGSDGPLRISTSVAAASAAALAALDTHVPLPAPGSVVVTQADVAAAIAGVMSDAGVGEGTAIAVVWQNLDGLYAALGPNDVNLNAAFVYLGLAYASYVKAGGAPLVDVVGKYVADGLDTDTLADRIQSLHDNLLGNLTDAALHQRYDAAGLYVQMQALVSAQDVSLPTRTVKAVGGYETDPAGSTVADGHAYDLWHGYASHASGQLTASDADAGNSLTWSIGSGNGTYGTIAIDASTGVWTYTLDDARPATQALGAGATTTETFIATVSDGHGGSAQQTVTITVKGTNDAPVIVEDDSYSQMPRNLNAVESTAPLQIQDHGQVGYSFSDIDFGDSVALDAVALQADGWSPGGGGWTKQTTYGDIYIVYQPGMHMQYVEYVVRDALREQQVITENVVVRVIDSQGAQGALSLTFTATGTNDAPIVTTQTNATVGEVVGNSSAQDIGGVTGAVTVADLDVGDTLRGSVVVNATADYNSTGPVPNGVDVAALVAYGAITFDEVTSNGGDKTLTWTYNPAAANLDWLNVNDTLTITYQAIIADGTTTVTQPITIIITGTNDAPIITSDAGVSVAENTPAATTVYQIVATDVDNPSLTFSLSGVDAALFDVSSTTGAVTFKAPPDFEAPNDADHDNVYNIVVHANDGSADVSRAVAIAVTDVAENHAPVIVPPAPHGGPILVSSSASGVAGNDASNNIGTPHFASGGNGIIFASLAGNLVAGDTNNSPYGNIFLKNLATGAVTLLSTDSNGNQIHGDNFGGVISRDGHYMAFTTDAAVDAAHDTNGIYDIYLKNLDTGAVQLVSHSTSGGAANSTNSAVSFSAISPDGRYVYYYSDASNLVSGDFGTGADLFRYDRVNNTNTLLSSTPALGHNNVYVTNLISASDDGRWVTYTIAENNFSANYILDTSTNTATRLSDYGYGGAQVTPDGHYVVYQKGVFDQIVYRMDLTTMTEQLVSVDMNGDPTPGSWPRISPNGNYVLYGSSLDTIVSGDTNTLNQYPWGYDLFVRNMNTGVTTRITLAADGSQGQGYIGDAEVRDDGTVVFVDGDALVSGDTNGTYDVYVTDVASAGGGSVTGTVVEDASPVGTAAGSIYFTDADLGDHHIASFVAQGGGTSYIGTFSLDASVTESNGSGSVGWHFTANGADLQSLGAGQVVHQYYDVKILDDANPSGFATTTVEIDLVGVNDTPTGSVTITGARTVGSTLTALDTLADADGLGSLHYQWQRGSGSTWTNIGTDLATYILTAGDFNNAIRVIVSYNDGYTNESVTSASVPFADNHAPVLTQAQAIGPGETLTKTANNNIGSMGNARNLDGHFGLGVDADIDSSTTIPHVSVDAATSNNRLDYYKFTVTAGSRGIFDIDGGYDSVIQLRDGSGVVIASNDDSLVADGAGGSPSNFGGVTYDSFLDYTFQNGGAYYLVVGRYNGGALDGSGNYVPANNLAGYNYQLQVSLENAVGNTTAVNVALEAEPNNAGAPVNGVTTGTLISSLVDRPGGGGYDNVDDADASDSIGIALTHVDTTHGVWWYSTDSGAHWTAINASSLNTQALLLSGSSQLYFQPTDSFVGTDTAAITFRAWDQSDGNAAGTLVAISSTGGTTPFSSGTANGNITIDVPFVANNDTISGGSAAPPDGGWTLFNGHYYKAFTSASGYLWSDANAGAQAAGGYLVSINSADENAFVRNLAPVNNLVWLGGSDSAIQNTWVWTGGPETGQVFWNGESGGSAPAGAYATWVIGEPNNWDGAAEDYLVMYETGQWADFTNDPGGNAVLTYVAEYSATANPTEDNITTIAASTLLANDTGTGLQITQVTNSLNGAIVTLNNGVISYDPTQAAAIQALNGGETLADTFTYTVTDAYGNTRTATVSVNVTGLNEPPTITSAPTATLAENDTSFVYQITATNPGAGAVTYSLSGADAALFDISPTGAVTFKAAPNFEAPLDAGQNNVYDIVVHASNGGDAQRAVQISVTNVNEAPVVANEPYAVGIGYIVNAPGGTLGSVYNSQSTILPASLFSDPEGATLAWSASNLPAGFSFVGNTRTLSFANTVATGIYDITITASDGEYSASQVVKVWVAGSTTSAVNDNGGSGNDTIIGGSSAFTYTAGSGNDFVDAGGGADTISGGDGNDVLYGSTNTAFNSFDTINGGNNDDYINGGANNDKLFGDAGNDWLVGEDGNDQLTGGTGDDTLLGNSGDDTFYYTVGDGTDRVYGGTGNDTFAIGGTASNDTVGVVISGGVITQLPGGTTLQDVENITLDLTQGGSDLLSYAATTESISVNLAAGTATGFTSIAGVENITGGSGNDTLTGDFNANVIIGNDGDDTITGGGGADTMTGGNGADTFIIATGDSTPTISGSSISGFDVIKNFSTVDDKLSLPGTLSTGSFSTTNDSTLTVSASGQTIKSHSISNGIIRFDDANTFSSAGAVTLGSNGDVAAAYQYLTRNDIGSAGATLAFAATIGGVSHTFIYTQGGSNNNNGTNTLVDLENTTLANLSTLIGNKIDPIVLDLNGQGIHFTSVQDGVAFDLDANGQHEQVAWTTGQEGILALDVDHNGTIDNGSEIFSPFFAGGSYADSLAALATLDSNGDGKIDAADAAFSDLKVWQDLNHDGISDPGELSGLADRGIASISLDASESGDAIDGQAVLANGTFTRTDGTTGHFVEVAFDTAAAAPPAADAPAPTASQSPAAASDSFDFTNLQQSLVGNVATIEDFQSGFDTIHIGHDLAGLVTGLSVNGTGDLAADLLSVLNGTNLVANGAAEVTINGGSNAGTYAVINDGSASFNAAQDAVIRIANQAVLHQHDFVI